MRLQLHQILRLPRQVTIHHQLLPVQQKSDIATSPSIARATKLMRQDVTEKTSDTPTSRQLHQILHAYHQKWRSNINALFIDGAFPGQNYSLPWRKYTFTDLSLDSLHYSFSCSFEWTIPWLNYSLAELYWSISWVNYFTRFKDFVARNCVPNLVWSYSFW